MSYEAVADALTERIVALMQAHPEVADLRDPWALFKVPGFDVSDLQPSLAQASFALAKAQEKYRRSGAVEPPQAPR